MRSRRSSARSQIAYSSAFRALRQASRWANWAIGPQPSTPIRNAWSSLAVMRLSPDSAAARPREGSQVFPPGHRGQGRQVFVHRGIP